MVLFPYSRRAAYAAVLAVMFAAGTLRAQCPDGSPPPCAIVRQAAMSVPSAIERGRRFLILPFRNLTGSSQYDWLIAGSSVTLSDAMEPWAEIRVVPDERLYPALERHGLRAGTALDLDKVRRVAAETGAWTAVFGEIVAFGPQVRIRVRAYDMAAADRPVATLAEDVGPSEEIRDAYSRIGGSLLRLAGLDSVTVDLAAVTTRSLDAYRAYARGLAQLSRGEARRARSSLQEAVRRDPNFAQAYARLAVAAAWEDPAALADPANPVFGWVERAEALSARLPWRESHLGETRRLLAALVAADSSDLEALGFLADLEFYDPILVPVPGGERPRGSLNTSVRLARRNIELEPSQLHAYRRLVDIYAAAGGAGRAVVIGVRGERPLSQMQDVNIWERVYVAVLRDTIELVPAESLATIPRETLVVRRRAAIRIARGWADQWLAAAPNESDAHLMLSYLHEASGQPDSALRELAIADELGIETGLEHVPLRRLALLVEAGRRREAMRHADRLIETLTPRDLAPISVERAATVVQALGSLFCLYATSGRIPDAGRLAELVGRESGGEEGALRQVLLSPAPLRSPSLALPSAMRVEAAESLLVRAARGPLPRSMDRLMPAVVELVLTDASGDDRERLAGRAADLAFTLADRGASETANALARVVDDASQRRARFAAAPWYRP